MGIPLDAIAVARNLRATALEFRDQSPGIAARLNQAAGVILQQQLTLQTQANRITSLRTEINTLRSVARV